MKQKLNTKNERRVGVLTFHRSANYGAVLQAYALQKCLKSIGFSPSLIDYIPAQKSRHARTSLKQEWLDRLNRMRRPKFILTAVGNRIRACLCRKKQARLSAICTSFIDRHTQVDPAPIFSQDSWKIEDSYHALITGSDQVWNTRWDKLDPVYFLNVDCDCDRRIAYAPSLGGLELPSNLKPRLRRYFDAYHSLSLREESSLAELRTCTDRPISIVPDPVFLIAPPLFKGRAEEVRSNSPYLLVYRLSQSLRQGAEFNKMVRSVAKKLNLKIISVSPESSSSTAHAENVLPDPENFVRLINGAALVITNSFHGLALSLIHKTPFYACPRDAHGGTQDARLRDLLTQFDMTHRFLTSANQFEQFKQKYDNIDWNSVERTRLSLKHTGINFLLQSLAD
ncbi:polysaccharide pyruvyl transferase family protein [Coraliomargarita sp. W4R72]